MEVVRNSKALAESAQALTTRCLDLARRRIQTDIAPDKINRGGRTAHDIGLT